MSLGKKKTTIFTELQLFKTPQQWTISKVSREGFINVFAPRSRSLLQKLAEMPSTSDALQILMMTVSFRRKQMILRTTVTETK